MLRETHGLPPLSPEEQIERLIRDEIAAQPVRKQWDRGTTYLLLGAVCVMVGATYALGLTPADVWDTVAQLFRDFPELNAMSSL